jgi:hypothetical protein
LFALSPPRAEKLFTLRWIVVVLSDLKPEWLRHYLHLLHLRYRFVFGRHAGTTQTGSAGKDILVDTRGCVPYSLPQVGESADSSSRGAG